MITILITQEDKKIKELLGSMLRQEGGAVPGTLDGAAAFLGGQDKEPAGSTDSLKSKVIELGESLYKEKNGTLYKSILETIEKPLLEHVLQRTEGNQLKAARILGINRNTMRVKIKKLGINPDVFKSQ